eukprot:1249119-Pyramimonas_sp.AAC.1
MGKCALDPTSFCKGAGWGTGGTRPRLTSDLDAQTSTNLDEARLQSLTPRTSRAWWRRCSSSARPAPPPGSCARPPGGGGVGRGRHPPTAHRYPPRPPRPP